MNKNTKTRRTQRSPHSVFPQLPFFVLFVSSCFQTINVQPAVFGQESQPETSVRENMVGPYGPWLADKVLGDGPARLSFRTGRFKTLDDWRKVARERVLDCMAPVDLGGVPEVRVEETL